MAKRTGSRDVAGRVVVSAVWVIGLTVVGKSLGLLKDIVVASRFGTSAAMDSYLLAFAIPVLITGWFRAPVRAGFIPLFAEKLEKSGEEEAWRAAGIVTTDVFVLTSIACVVAILLAPWIVSAIAPGFDAESHALASSLARIMLVAIIFMAMSGLLTNLLHCYKNFAVPGVVTSVNNLVLIAAALFLTPIYGIRGLAFGYVGGTIAQFLVQSRILWLHRRHVRFRVDFRHPMFRSMTKLALPLFIGMAGAKLDGIIDRIFASMLVEGSLSGLVYALRLVEIPREMLAIAFSTVLFPFFSAVAAKGDYDELANKLFLSIRIAFFVLLPVSVGMALLGDPLVRAVYQRGAFDEVSVMFTRLSLVYYAPEIWAFGLSTIVTSAFMAMKNTRTPVIAGLVRLGVKVLLVFVFIDIMKHAGVALATSTSHILKLIILLFLLPKELSRGRFPKMLRGFAGAAVATAVMGVVVKYAWSFTVGLSLPNTLGARIGALAGVSLVGSAVYVAAASLVARAELKATLRALRSGVSNIVRRSGIEPAEDS
jgi:putative peptidoglycan lipid II flippase